MTTSFEHKYKIGDTVFYIYCQTVEQGTIDSINYYQYVDDTGTVITEFSYKLDNNLYLEEGKVFDSLKEAEKSYSMIELLESQIDGLEKTIERTNQRLAEYRKNLQNCLDSTAD